jgi:hypothetical protein
VAGARGGNHWDGEDGESGANVFSLALRVLLEQGGGEFLNGGQGFSVIRDGLGYGAAAGGDWGDA